MTHAKERRAQHLHALAREELEAFLLKRAEEDEDFAFWLDARLAASMLHEANTPLDPAPFRRRVEALLCAAGSGHRRRHWNEWGAEVDEAALEDLIGEAEPFLAAGRGADALAILTPVAGALADYWPECADWDETLHEYFPHLDGMLAQAVLMDGVSQEVRDDLVDELDGWQDKLADYGADDAFSTAIAACLQGWDEPGLEDALAGRAQNWPFGGRGDDLEDALTRARLAALDAMGRTEAYLYLSLAAGFYCAHAVKLARMGCVDEAVAFAHARLSAPDDILHLVQAVVAATGQGATSFDLAAWGLSLPADKEDRGDWYPGVSKISLARWLRDAAQEAGRRDMVLLAAQAAFEESLAREDFRAASRLAGATDWPALRETLLATLLAAPHAYERLEILLDEDMIDEAVACVDPQEGRFFSLGGRTLERLAERAYGDHPDWAIALAFRMADPIMNEGRSTHYDIAAEWLGIAARAHAASGRSGEWAARLDGLIETYYRKYKLRPLLEALRHSAC
jgi:uncharacterized Zn finger protein